ncbi:hypothetical protein [Mesorhizobium sp. CAU 1741]|uniref:hypothetical protein n=1 Tax=Mesorhizobium sp. CAU 1741 TaxID=3140366 RepID=UPI00325AE5BA
MRTLLLACVVAVAGVGAAQPNDAGYDEKLAHAAARIVASRMGDLRGGLDFRSRIELVETISSRADGGNRMRPGVWRDGLAIAVERKSTVSPEL